MAPYRADLVVLERAPNRAMNSPMNPWYIEAIGVIAAILTTLCWMPQALKILRDRDTRAISLVATLALMTGVGFWLAYGIALQNWPLIGSNSVTFALISVILALKLRYG